MKARKFLLLGFLLSCMLTGCKTEEGVLVAGELETSTILINKSGGVQAALVEAFEKDYYSDTELKQFLENIIKEYNNKFGENSVSLDSFAVEDKVASAVFKYDNVNHFKNLTEEWLEFGTIDEVKADIPDVITDINGKEASLETITTSKYYSKYKVIMTNEKYDVKVEGTVQYYFNCTLLNTTMVHTAGDGVSIVIYK